MKIEVGTVCKSKKFKSTGTCVKIDPTNNNFRYLFKFDNKSIAWMSKSDIKKDMKVKTPLELVAEI